MLCAHVNVPAPISAVPLLDMCCNFSMSIRMRLSSVCSGVGSALVTSRLGGTNEITSAV